MLPAERKRKIVELVTDQDGCSVGELSESFDFSKATIRRDLEELEEEGLIERSHGGAVPVTSVGQEQTYGQREVQNLDAKSAIAERAVEEIRDGQVVFFDAGTTTMEVAKRAPKDGSFLAVANSPLQALEFATETSDVKMTGGTLRRNTRALVGPSAESFMDRTNFDLLFLGTNSIDAERGLTTPNEEEARIKGLMVENSARVVLVADETKLGERSFVQFADLEQIDLFVTNADLTGRERRAFDNADVNVEVVSP